jgi:hypothetical protein
MKYSRSRRQNGKKTGSLRMETFSLDNDRPTERHYCQAFSINKTDNKTNHISVFF